MSRKWLESLRSEAKDTVDLLGNARKPEREQRTCKAFLRCLGIRFWSDQVICSPSEPPDVLFDSARFEVTVIYDDGRQIHAEWKAEGQRREAASEVRDLFFSYRPKQALTDSKLIRLLTEALTKKASRYAKRPQSCSDLDALIYVNQRVELAGALSTPFDLPEQQGWRSVSVLVPPRSCVLYAGAGAPRFLSDLVGQIKEDWPKPFGMFDD